MMTLIPKAVRCPLCHAQMVHTIDTVRKVAVMACHFDKIAIAADDPMLGKWESAMEKMGEEALRCPMPGCDTKMRFFCTSTGYMKAKCPVVKCGATWANPVAPEIGLKPSILMKPQVTREPGGGGGNA